MTDWAHRIQRLEAAGWSLTDLAQHLGVAVSTLSDIKNGRTLEPKGMSAVRLYQLDLHVHAPAPEPAPSDQQAA